MQPGFTRTAVGVREDQHFKFFRKLLDGHAQIVHLFAAVDGVSGNYQVRFYARGFDDPIDNLARWVFIRSQNKKNLVVLAIKLR